MDEGDIDLACQALRRGGVIAYPTEAVWGLGCDPANQQAVERILALKQRAVDKGLILVASEFDQIEPLLEGLDESQLQQLQTTWPGPITWLIPDTDDLYPPWIKGTHASVAIRISAHPTVKALCSGFGGPIVSTSANRAGEPEIRSRSRLQQELAHKIDCVVPGELGSSAEPSEIRDLVSGRIIR